MKSDRRILLESLLHERFVDDDDGAGGCPVAVGECAAARQPDAHRFEVARRDHSKLGIDGGVRLSVHRLRLPKDAPPWMREAPREIVGIVADVREGGLRSEPKPAAYVPQSQVPDGVAALLNRFLPLALAVKTQGEPLAAAQNVRQMVLSVDPLQPVAEIRSMDEIVSRATGRDRFSLTLMGIFAFVALALAAIGIYGVISYSVSQRTRELGVRIALGASPAHLLRVVMGEGMLTSTLGVAVGLAGAYGLSRFLAQLLFSVKAADPLTFAAVAGLMLAVALVANLIPALRATRIDPIRALRYE